MKKAVKMQAIALKKCRGTKILTLLFLLTSAPLWADTAANDKQLYQVNCQACHLLTQTSVGPSLAEIAGDYPKGQLQEFLSWVKNPGRKRPNSIQMPAIGYLSDDELSRLHQYILQEAQSLTPSKEPVAAGFTPPDSVYPYVKRAYMPFVSPAAIAVALNSSISLSWDTVGARLAYVYPSEADFFNGHTQQADKQSLLRYQETASQFWSAFTDNSVTFLGYRLIDQLPEFYYRSGDIVVSEKITLPRHGNGFIRQFTTQGINKPVSLNFAHKGNAKLTATTGKLTNSTLELTPVQAKSFSVKVELL